MTDRELMQQALDALEHLQTDIEWQYKSPTRAMLRKVEKSLRARLAQPEQAPTNNGRYLTGYKAQPEQEPVVTGETSDGYHTFNELYEFRKAYNAALFNEWAANQRNYVHKSWRHHDGDLCFGGGWFIVVAKLIGGQISNHYKAEDWNLFQVPETEKALFEFDGHTGADVIARLKGYTAPPVREWQGLTDEEAKDTLQAVGIDTWFSYRHAARAIEQALKEKNHA